MKVTSYECDGKRWIAVDIPAALTIEDARDLHLKLELEIEMERILEEEGGAANAKAPGGAG